MCIPSPLHCTEHNHPPPAIHPYRGLGESSSQVGYRCLSQPQSPSSTSHHNTSLASSSRRPCVMALSFLSSPPNPDFIPWWIIYSIKHAFMSPLIDSIFCASLSPALAHLMIIIVPHDSSVIYTSIHVLRDPGGMYICTYVHMYNPQQRQQEE